MGREADALSQKSKESLFQWDFMSQRWWQYQRYGCVGVPAWQGKLTQTLRQSSFLRRLPHYLGLWLPRCVIFSRTIFFQPWLSEGYRGTWCSEIKFGPTVSWGCVLWDICPLTCLSLSALGDSELLFEQRVQITPVLYESIWWRV